MREIPIPFSTPMVQAILDNRKTMTRRTTGLDDINLNPDEWDFKNLDFLGYMAKKSARGKYGAYFESTKIEPNTLLVCPVVCPYGQPGDRLWVRETWCKLWKLDSNEQIIEGTENYYYAADGYNPTPFNWFPDADGANGWRDGPRWKPSIHMPKVAARIWLEVVSVRVERLQDITEADAEAEGISFEQAMECSGWSPTYNDPDGSNAYPNYKEAFRELWNSINLKRGYGWDSNPWVWVVEFRRVE